MSQAGILSQLETNKGCSQMPKIYVTTNGCEFGQVKSMQLKNFFMQNGFSEARTWTNADFVVFFACGLTDPQEKDSMLLIRKFQEEKERDAKLIVWGCLPKVNPRNLQKIYKGPIVGPQDLAFFENLLNNKKLEIADVTANTLVKQKKSGIETFPHMSFDPIIFSLKKVSTILDLVRLPKRRGLFDPNSFFIQVSEGCLGNCTYCTEKPIWGGVKSRSVEKIVEEFKTGLAKGYTRFFLISMDLGTYGTDIGTNLVELLSKLVKIENKTKYSIIINEMYPSYLKDMLPKLEEIFSSGRIETFGCQVESGSTRILSLMGRRYSPEDWRACMLRINKSFPFIRLSTHIMIGFPTETDEDFDATLKLLDFPLFMDSLGMFTYSPRPTEHAHNLPDHVSLEVNQRRFKKLCRKYLFMHSLNVVLGNIRYVLHRH